MVEFQPSKLAVVGSTPTARSKWYDPTLFVTQLEAKVEVRNEDDWIETDDLRNLSRMTQDNHMAHVAQLVEHVLGKDEVTRSIRVVGSIPHCPAGASFGVIRRSRKSCSF